MKTFTIGRYVPYGSGLHKMDARAKLAMIVFLMVALFLPFEGWAMNFIMLGGIAVVVIALLYLSRMSIRSIFSSLKSMWFVVLLLLVLYCLLPYKEPTLPLLFELEGWKVYWDSIVEAVRIIVRLFLMLGLTMSLTASTKPLDLTYAFEWYLSPLKPLHFPTAEVAMTISIALRFIPTLLDDTQRVMKAQESRGTDFRHGGLKSKVGSLVSLIVPLFVSSFTRSEELANAMECRGYDPREKRTRYRVLKFNFWDLFFVLLSIGLMAFYIYASASGLRFC